MALKMTYTDAFGRVIVDAYWRIEGINAQYPNANFEGAGVVKVKQAAITVKAYPSKVWADNGQPAMDGKVAAVKGDAAELVAASVSDSVRTTGYTLLKADPFFATAVDA